MRKLWSREVKPGHYWAMMLESNPGPDLSSPGLELLSEPGMNAVFQILANGVRIHLHLVSISRNWSIHIPFLFHCNLTQVRQVGEPPSPLRAGRPRHSEVKELVGSDSDCSWVWVWFFETIKSYLEKKKKLFGVKSAKLGNLSIYAKSGMFNINLHIVDHLMWFIDWSLWSQFQKRHFRNGQKFLLSLILNLPPCNLLLWLQFEFWSHIN